MSNLKKTKTFGLDWDGTADSDPELFKLLCAVLRSSGHKVYIVTMRYPSEFEAVIEDMCKWVDGVVTTCRQAKMIACAKAGIKIDVWIDDNPRAVTQSAEQIWGCASEEGTILGSSGAVQYTDNELKRLDELRSALENAGVSLPS